MTDPLDPRAYQAAFELMEEPAAFVDGEGRVAINNNALDELLGTRLREAGEFAAAFEPNERPRVEAFLHNARQWSEATLHTVHVAGGVREPLDLVASQYVGGSGERLLLVRARTVRARVDAERLHEAGVLAARACNQATTREDLAARAPDVLAGALPQATGTAWLERRKDRWHVVTASGVLLGWSGRSAFAPASLWGRFASAGESLLIADTRMELRGEEAAMEAELSANSLVVSPLLVAERVEGLLLTVGAEVAAFSMQDVRVVDAVAREIASALGRLRAYDALAVSNARLTDSLQERDALLSQLRRLNAELEDFALWTTHDLREPLRGLAHLAEEIATEAGRERSAELHDIAKHFAASATRLKEQIRELHAFHEEARDVPVREEVGLEPLARKAAAALEGHVELQVAGPAPHVLAHPARIERAISNVLTFARAQSPSGALAVRLSTREGLAHLWVGIPQRLPPRAAEAAFHVSKPHSLALARRITLQHGGSLAFAHDAEPSLVLTLPLVPAARDAPTP